MDLTLEKKSSPKELMYDRALCPLGLKEMGLVFVKVNILGMNATHTRSTS